MFVASRCSELITCTTLGVMIVNLKHNINKKAKGLCGCSILSILNRKPTAKGNKLLLSRKEITFNMGLNLRSTVISAINDVI